ncbi:PKD domain-containing protein [Candidatus Solincola sp.]
MGGEIIAERFSLLKTRGSNGLAFTHIVEDILDGRRLVVKVSDRLGILGLEYLKAANLLAESGAQGVLLPLEGGLLDGEEGYYLAFPELGEPSLENYLRMRPFLTCEEVIHILRGVLSALEGLHRAGFLHLFLEPRNIFYLPRRSVTLKDPALRAEFFHSFLEMVSAPDFSYLHPALMDGGLPGPEADLYALGKLAGRLHASAADGDASLLGRAILGLARACEEVAGQGTGAPDGGMVGAMVSLRQDLERALVEARSREEGAEGRLRSALRKRRSKSSGEDSRVEEEPGREASCPSAVKLPAPEVEDSAGGRFAHSGLAGHEGPFEDFPEPGVGAGTRAVKREPEAAGEKDRFVADSGWMEVAGGGSSARGETSGVVHSGVERAGRFSRSRRGAMARAFRVAALVACIGLLLSLPIYFVAAREGESMDPVLGWGASEAGGGRALFALQEARRGPAEAEGRGGVEVTEEGGMTAGEEGTPVIPAQGSAPVVKGAEPPLGEKANGGEGPVSPQRPVACFTVTPSEGQSPLRVYLDASGSYDPDGHIVSYQWSCGGGAKAFYQVFESNLIPARIAVTLTVTDDGGNMASVTHYVTLY